MSWIECRSKTQYNRTGYLMQDQVPCLFKFKWLDGGGVSDGTMMQGAEVQKQIERIETPSTLKFDNMSLLKIDGILYNVESVSDSANLDANGEFRGKSVTIRQLTIARRI
ncbi:MAG: hypothetical protein LMBGKNDO_00813 [Bacteroidales bacterium]|jgi:hypothetical protein|nr:hypothetical protein [Bacteroidales bacterium]